MTDEMTDERLAEIRERADAAMAGPWERVQPGEYDLGAQSVKGAAGQTVAFTGYGLDPLAPARNAEFIAHARADVPALLDEVERLRGEVQRLESSKLLAASMVAESYCGEEVERLREQVATLRAEAKACGVTGLDPCPWHPDGGNHPESAR